MIQKLSLQDGPELLVPRDWENLLRLSIPELRIHRALIRWADEYADEEE